MGPQLLAALQRLADAQIELVPVTEFRGFFVFSRDGFVALVERRDDASGQPNFGSVGSVGLFTGKTLAPLVQRLGEDGQELWCFQAKGFSQPATPEQRALAQAFQRDLVAAIQG